ncbi:MAG TPA: manganese efflux pump MntP family protein [Lachnospiraceae bacterium]|nr:manganese efflux pump MntP family protein [Lachnospiraceae bacterium]
MGIVELLILGVGLSMDAFAVAICKGLSTKKMNWKNAFITGLYFGGFQALMPLLGYILGEQFKNVIVTIDHWIIFFLLLLIGINMIKKSREKVEKLDDCFDVHNMLLLGIATSIDALAVGVTFAFLKVSIILAISVIGTTTFLLSVLGFKVGNVFGIKFKSRAELAGGIILIYIGIKILLEHLEILSF